MSDRPYPEGIAWDEAWRQRKRADKLERRMKDIAELISTGHAKRIDPNTIREAGDIAAIWATKGD